MRLQDEPHESGDSEQAANQMVRLAPDDPMSAQILAGFDRARIQSAATRPVGKQRLVWF